MNKKEKVLGKMYSGDIKALLYKLRRPRDSRTGGETRNLLSWLDDILQTELNTRHAVTELDRINMEAGQCRRIPSLSQKKDDCAKAMNERIHMMRVQEQQDHAVVARQEQDFKDHHLGRTVILGFFKGDRIDQRLRAAYFHLKHSEAIEPSRIELCKNDWDEICDGCIDRSMSLHSTEIGSSFDGVHRDELAAIKEMRDSGEGLDFRRIPMTRGESTKFFFEKPA